MQIETTAGVSPLALRVDPHRRGSRRARLRGVAHRASWSGLAGLPGLTTREYCPPGGAHKEDGPRPGACSPKPPISKTSSPASSSSPTTRHAVRSYAPADHHTPPDQQQRSADLKIIGNSG